MGEACPVTGGIPGGGNDMEAVKRGFLRAIRGGPTPLRDMGRSALVLLAATLIGFLFYALGFTEANIIAVYLFAVLVCSVITTGPLCGLLASAVSVLVFNFFFTVPRFTFRFSDPNYLVTMPIMLMVALLTGSLTTQLKNNIREKEEAAALARSEQLRANLLRAISHDLRTPLTSIAGSAGNLLANYEKMDEADRVRTFTDIYDDSRWLINLVENLLAITRIEGGQVRLTQSVELMDEVVSEALRHIDRHSSEHSIQSGTSDDLILAKIDAKLIVQVLINLVDNAIKYTPPGSEIRIHTEKQGQWVVVTVSDNGPGIPDGQKPRVFEMFYSGANRAADSRRSLGLGLALCKSIVTAHGGTISVSDNRPHGTVFTFTLPAGEVELHE